MNGMSDATNEPQDDAPLGIWSRVRVVLGPNHTCLEDWDLSRSSMENDKYFRTAQNYLLQQP